MVDLIVLHRFRRFLVIGGFGFLVDLSVFVVGSKAGLPIVAARLVSFGAALVFTFLLNRSYTYARRDDPIVAQFAKYVIASGTGATVNLASFFILIMSVPMATKMPSLALVFASLAGLGVNFVLYSAYVFRSK